MSQYFLNSIVDLKFELTDEKEKGSFKGVAYSGKTIPYHAGLSNLITDIDTLSFKKQIPVFRDHDSTKVVGKAFLFKEAGQLMVEGKLFKKSKLAQEVMDFSEDGFNWELSIGMSVPELISYEQDQEFEVNGQTLKGPAYVIKNANVNEVSFVPIGADSSAFATVFSNDIIKKSEVIKMEIIEEKQTVEFTKEQWIEFACACGGKEESSLDDLKAEVKKLKEEKEKIEKELAKYTEDKKKEKIEKAISDFGIELSEEKMTELLSDDSKFEFFLQTLEIMPKPEKKIDQKFTEVVVVEASKEEVSDEQKRAKRLALAQDLVKSGKAQTLIQAISMIPDSEY